MTELLKSRIKNGLIADFRNQVNSEAPSYFYEELVDRLISGTHGSVTKETANYLLRRNLKPSEKNPGKYYFSRDGRLKFGFKLEQPHHVTLELAKSINMPYLSIKAEKFIYYGGRKSHYEVVNILEKNPNFFHHIIDANHHLHLTDPEKVSKLISDFIYKYRNNRSKL